MPVITLLLASDWLKVKCFHPPRSKCLLPRLLLSAALQGPDCLFVLLLLPFLAEPVPPHVPARAELPGQLWGHLFIPTTLLLGQLSLVRLWLWLTVTGLWPGVPALCSPGPALPLRCWHEPREVPAVPLPLNQPCSLLCWLLCCPGSLLNDFVLQNGPATIGLADALAKGSGVLGGGSK